VSVGHYENFPVASRLVPAELRPAVVAIYRFARSADDIADEGDAPPHERLAALASYDAALEAIARGETPQEAPFHDLAHAIRAHALPISLLHALISAFRQDVTTKRYATYAAVLDYCARSANPVGRLLLALYRREGEDNLRWSDAICTGLQLTNFWQDVAIDWKKERVYLPQEDLDRFGVSLEDIADAAGGASACGASDGVSEDVGKASALRGRSSKAEALPTALRDASSKAEALPKAPRKDRALPANLRALMLFETARTRALLESGRPLVRALPFRLGLELSAVIAGGLRILSRIDAADGDVFRHRPVLRKRDWAMVAYRAVVS
jgi:squalene synthase HpnC